MCIKIAPLRLRAVFSPSMTVSAAATYLPRLVHCFVSFATWSTEADCLMWWEQRRMNHTPFRLVPSSHFAAATRDSSTEKKKKTHHAAVQHPSTMLSRVISQQRRTPAFSTVSASRWARRQRGARVLMLRASRGSKFVFWPSRRHQNTQPVRVKGFFWRHAVPLAEE